MRSLRVDQAYRVILAAPEDGNIYLFLWVDHHDKAYDWAASHQCKVNPNTGELTSIVGPEGTSDFNTPTSLAFGTGGPWNRKSVFVANAALQYGQSMEPWAPPGVVEVYVGKPGK